MTPRLLWFDFLSAVQFLTRVPVPNFAYREDSLSRAVKFFPLVGLLVGAAGGGVYLLLAPHLPALVTSAIVLIFLVSSTGCFHEDGLADTADGFGGGWNREQILLILRDSRIGSYGGAALSLTLLTRCVLIAAVAPGRVLPALCAAHVLCRWTTIPLSYFLPAARSLGSEPEGQGARIATLTSLSTLLGSTLFSFTCAGLFLHWRAIGAVLCVCVFTLLSGLYYRSRIGGVTGDCFGATNQIAEILVYVCTVWTR